MDDDAVAGSPEPGPAMTPSPLEPAEMALTREQQDEILALGDAAYAAAQVADDGLPVDPAGISMPNLAKADHAAIHAGEPRRERRSSAIAELSGTLTGVYEPGYLDDLRRDWPE